LRWQLYSAAPPHAACMHARCRPSCVGIARPKNAARVHCALLAMQLPPSRRCRSPACMCVRATPRLSPPQRAHACMHACMPRSAVSASDFHLTAPSPRQQRLVAAEHWKRFCPQLPAGYPHLCLRPSNCCGHRRLQPPDLRALAAQMTERTDSCSRVSRTGTLVTSLKGHRRLAGGATGLREGLR
jgi:hypothetical protein